MPSPALKLTPRILQLATRVSELLGRFAGVTASPPLLRLRRVNRIRTVQGSVAIEGNTLSTEQITALLEGKRVVAPKREILEVQNALAAYERAPRWNPWAQRDLLLAHGTLMKGLIPDAGHWRKGGVGVMHGTKVAHVAPPAGRAPVLTAELLEWAKRSELPPLITSSVVHYELQFIHPFSDGNGRMGRLWQHVALLGVSPIFAFSPVESVIRGRQDDYYAALGKADRSGDAAPFVEFSLDATSSALEELLVDFQPERETAQTRLAAAKEVFGAEWFARADYSRLHKRLSSASASRDLREGVDEKQLLRKGDRRTSRYRFKS